MRFRIGPELEAITERIIASAYQVSNTLGCGFLEVLYKRALLREMRDRGLLVKEEVPFQVKYKGDPIGNYFADIVVERCVIVELKAVDALADIHVNQVLNYLRASGLGVGLLLNFGQPRVTVRRVVA